MDIRTPEHTFNDIYYDDSSLNELSEHLKQSKEKKNHHLCLFLGLYEDGKEEALQELSENLELIIKKVDFNNLVSKVESETFENMDRFFSKHNSSEVILYFRNGDKLCGVYTGFTHSRVKYATPQERYFLKKVQAFKRFIIVDIPEYTDADTTIRRAAQSIVKFVLPKSPVKRFMWRLKHYSLNGYDIKTKRPEVYGETQGNF